MTVRNWGPVRDCMRTDVTEVDGKLDVLSALKVMKEVGATSLIVKRRDENDEFGMLLFSDIANEGWFRDCCAKAERECENDQPENAAFACQCVRKALADREQGQSEAEYEEGETGDDKQSACCHRYQIGGRLLKHKYLEYTDYDYNR